MNNIELKPCPFCGGKAKIRYEHLGYTDKIAVCISCRDCKVRTPLFVIDIANSFEKKAIDAWNTRYYDNPELLKGAE